MDTADQNIQGKNCFVKNYASIVQTIIWLDFANTPKFFERINFGPKKIYCFKINCCTVFLFFVGWRKC